MSECSFCGFVGTERQVIEHSGGWGCAEQLRHVREIIERQLAESERQLAECQRELRICQQERGCAYKEVAECRVAQERAEADYRLAVSRYDRDMVSERHGNAAAAIMLRNDVSAANREIADLRQQLAECRGRDG